MFRDSNYVYALFYPGTHLSLVLYEFADTYRCDYCIIRHQTIHF